MTIGRRPWRRASMIEPTPAWQTNTRALAHLLGELVEGQEVDPLAAPVRHARGAVLDEQLLVAAELRAARTSRSKGCSLVPMVTRIIGPRTGCRRSGCGRAEGSASSGHCAYMLRGDRRDHARAQRQALDPRDALDVDRRDPQQLADPGERDGDAGARREDRRRPLARAAPGTRAGGCAAGSGCCGSSATERVDHALVAQQRAGVGLVERDPHALEARPRVAQLLHLQQVPAGASRRSAAGASLMTPPLRDRDPGHGRARSSRSARRRRARRRGRPTAGSRTASAARPSGATAAISAGSSPSSTLVPCVSVTGRSVLGRNV